MQDMKICAIHFKTAFEKIVNAQVLILPVPESTGFPDTVALRY
jgi:hypothetical protein